MTSGKKARLQRRTPAPPPVRSKGGSGRRASPKVLAAAVAVVVLAAVAAALAFALTGGSSSKASTTGPASALPDSSAAISLFKGIPQHGNVLGKPNAPVTMVEYIDLQCPICRAFETGVMPTIVPKFVRTGKVKVIARTIAFIGPDSQRGRAAALAAGRQNHFFDFAQLAYFNQGSENSGWLDDQFIRSAYASIPGLDAAAAEQARTAGAVAQEASTFESQANADNVTGTPTIFVGKTGGKLTEIANPDVPTLGAALKAALKS
jgi:protein-disulfide isomerase